MLTLLLSYGLSLEKNNVSMKIKHLIASVLLFASLSGGIMAGSVEIKSTSKSTKQQMLVTLMRHNRLQVLCHRHVLMVKTILLTATSLSWVALMFVQTSRANNSTPLSG